MNSCVWLFSLHSSCVFLLQKTSSSWCCNLPLTLTVPNCLAGDISLIWNPWKITSEVKCTKKGKASHLALIIYVPPWPLCCSHVSPAGFKVDLFFLCADWNSSERSPTPRLRQRELQVWAPTYLQKQLKWKRSQWKRTWTSCSLQQWTNKLDTLKTWLSP